MEKRRILIKGSRVIGIGYRPFLYREASRLGLPNFDALNIQNEVQIVEVLVGGDRGVVEEFVSFAKTRFPPAAVVEDVAVEDYLGHIRSMESFERWFMLDQQSKIAGPGLAMVRQMLTKQDQSLAKQDEHIEITREGFTGLKNTIERGLAELKEESQKTRVERLR